MLSEYIEKDEHSLDYVNHKLKGAYLKHIPTGMPIQISEVFRHTSICLTIDDVAEYENSDIEVYDLPLGWGYLTDKYSGETYLGYTSKVPVRRVWRQGLTPQYIYETRDLALRKVYFRDGRDIFTLLQSTFNPSYSRLEDDGTDKIISPKLMVDKRGNAYYLGVRVGTADYNLGSILLKREYSFLDEEVNR